MSDVLKGVEWAAEATEKEEATEKKKGKKSTYKVSQGIWYGLTFRDQLLTCLSEVDPQKLLI